MRPICGRYIYHNKQKYKPKKIIEVINRYDVNVQFTIEKKNNRSLAYLDVKITHLNEKIQTTVYRKPTTNLKITIVQRIHLETITWLP